MPKIHNFGIKVSCLMHYFSVHITAQSYSGCCALVQQMLLGGCLKFSMNGLLCSDAYLTARLDLGWFGLGIVVPLVFSRYSTDAFDSAM